MNRLLKTFLLWLLIAALPLQGMAAVVKASCGPRHHSLSTLMSNAADHHHEAGAGHHAHDAAHIASPAANADLVDANTGGLPDAGETQNSSYCSACAACCVGAAAPPSSVAVTPTFGNSVAAGISPPASFTGFIPAGLERPPKHLSA